MNRRMVGIIEYLIKNRGMANIKEMAKILDVNERTVRYDVETINELLSENSFSPIEKLGKGELKHCNLSELKNFLLGIENLEAALSSEFKEILILIKIAFEEEVNINRLCETFDLSRTTIKTALKEVKNIMGVYNLELVVNPLKGLKIAGSEENLRRLQLKLLNQYTTLKDETLFEYKFIEKNISKYFLEINQNSIKIFINYIMRSLERIISDEAYSTISNYISIMIERIKKDKGVHFQPNEKFFSETDEFENIAKALPLLEATYNIKISRHELIKLTDYFLGSHIYKSDSEFFGNWIEIELLIKNIIKNFSDEFDMDLKKDETLLDGLINHLKPAIHRAKNKIELQNSIYDEFLERYPHIYRVTESSLVSLNNFIGEEISKDEIAFIAMHFKAAIDRNSFEKKEVKNILLVCGLGYGTSKLLAQQIREHYNVNIVATIPLNMIEKYINNQGIDLIITTISSEHFETFETEIPVITIKTLFTQEDFNKLEKYNLPKYDRRFLLSAIINSMEKSGTVENKKLLIKELKSIFQESLIDDVKFQEKRLSYFLNENNILLNQEVETWHDAIRLAGSLMVEREIILESYVDSMIGSIEKNGPYMVIADYVALPHAKNRGDVLKTGIVLVTLKKAVEFSKEVKVDTILAFSSGDNKEHLNALTEFIDLLKKYNFQNLLKNTTSKKKIIEQIKKYEFLANLGK